MQGMSGTSQEHQEKELIPAPQIKRSDYPNMGFSSRSVVWIIAQLHLFFAAFVLAVPLFVLVIELIGFKTGDLRCPIPTLSPVYGLHDACI